MPLLISLPIYIQVENKLSALSFSLKETEEGRQEVQTQLEQTSEQLLQVQSQLQLAEQVWFHAHVLNLFHI